MRRKSVYLLPCLVLSSAISSEVLAASPSWRVYTDIDLFAFSEPVSVDQFASDFNDSLDSGDTGFTHDKYEVGVEWEHFRLAYVHRFDYLTEFTGDTALFHHSEKNGITLPQDRNYTLLLDVERLEAKGLKAGFDWQFDNGMRVDVAYTYYSDLKKLQSGKASAFGDLEPLNAQLRADAKAIIDGLSTTNTDLSGLIPIAEQVTADILIDYAYDAPKFGEPDYQKPVITGAPNPPLTGVSFAPPTGTGHSVDITLGWQVNERLDVNLELIDIYNRFNWDNAPQTYARFNVNAFLLDAINVAQDYVDGKIVTPNDLIDRHLTVEITNSNFTQKLPMRADFSLSYDLNNKYSIGKWTPNIAALAGYYHTDTHAFPRLGLSIARDFKFFYDFGGEALILAYEGKYGHIKLITDNFDWEKAHTLGFSAGLQFRF